MRLPLPLLLVAAMLAIGAAMEVALFDGLALLPKLPLALLLATAAVRAARERTPPEAR